MMCIFKSCVSIVCLILIFLPSCGPGLQEGFLPVDISTEEKTLDSDTGSDFESQTHFDSDTNTDSAPDSVEDADTNSDLVDTLTSLECSDVSTYSVFFANNLLENSRFVAMSGNCLLLSLQEENGYRAAAVFTSPFADNNILSSFEASIPLPPKSIICRYDPVEKINSAFILATDGTESAIYKLTDDIGLFEEIHRDSKLTGLARLLRTETPSIDEICAYGNGIKCSSKSSQWTQWKEELSPQANITVNRMTVMSCEEGWCYLAVGPKGGLYIHRQNEWKRIPVDTVEDLVAVSDRQGKFVAAGNNGTVVVGNAESAKASTIAEGKDILSLSWYEYYFQGVTSDGYIVRGIAENDILTASCINPQQIEGNVVDAMYFVCEQAANYVILRQDSLIGDYDCSLISVI